MKESRVKNETGGAWWVVVGWGVRFVACGNLAKTKPVRKRRGERDTRLVQEDRATEYAQRGGGVHGPVASSRLPHKGPLETVHLNGRHKV